MIRGMRTCGYTLSLSVMLLACGSQDDDTRNAGDGVDSAVPPATDASEAATFEEGGTYDASDASDAAMPIDWQTIREPGDPEGDCLTVDTTCNADLLQVEYAQDTDSLRFAIVFASSFPTETGSLELFMMPPSPPLVGYSVQQIGGQTTLWKADCSTARGAWRHAGCHWSKMPTPDHLETGWVDDTRFELSIDSTALFGNSPELLVGAGAAPFAIQKTAEFTDRYPDEVWVTSTEIKGLVGIVLE